MAHDVNYRVNSSRFNVVFLVGDDYHHIGPVLNSVIIRQELVILFRKVKDRLNQNSEWPRTSLLIYEYS